MEAMGVTDAADVEWAEKRVTPHPFSVANGTVEFDNPKALGACRTERPISVIVEATALLDAANL